MSQLLIFSTKAVKAILGAQKHFYCRKNSEVITELRVLNVRYVISVTIMSQIFLVRVREINQLNNQITNMSKMLVDKIMITNC